LKQSETKDQTRKDVKIKGSNYNSYRGLDYKIVKTAKDRIENIHFEILKRRRFHYSLSPSKKSFSALKQGYVLQQIAPIIGHVLWLLSWRPLPPQCFPWAIKARGGTVARGGKREQKEEEKATRHKEKKNREKRV
jgi:hypothetical protein